MLNLIKRLCFSGILCFLLCFMIPTMMVHAEPTTGGNADSSDGGSGTRPVIGGPYYDKSGWFVYLVEDVDGNDTNFRQISKTLVLYSTDARPDNSFIKYLKTKFGGKVENVDYDSNLTPEWTPKSPYEANGTANGSAIKSYMLQDNNVINFVEQYFNELDTEDSKILQRFVDEKIYLILEPFYWGQMYKGGEPTGINLCATAYGWAEYQERLRFGEYGPWMINRFTNNTYPNCVKLERQQFNLEAPKSGKLTNKEIMASGNGFMAFWAFDELTQPPEEEETDSEVTIPQLYEIKNWSGEFDISKAIPSGETVNQAYEADPFWGHGKFKTITTSPQYYSATYTYTWEVEHSEIQTDPATGLPLTNENGDLVYHTWTTTDSCQNTFSFSARASYQVVTDLELYGFNKLLVANNALVEFPTFEKKNSYQWYDVTTDVKRYTFDPVYTNTGLLGCMDIAQSHYYLPGAEFVGDQTIAVGNEEEARARMDADETAAKQAVNAAAWSRNDNLVVKAGRTYTFMQDVKVPGCIISGYSDTSAATSDYRYGGTGVDLESVKPDRNKGELANYIPQNTDNRSYPTGTIATYDKLASTKNENPGLYYAGRAIFAGNTVDDIYEHVIETPENTNHNGKDYPQGDAYDIKVHTPVIAPIMITSYLGTPQWYPDEQLIDVDVSADFQLKLDGDYMVKWNLDQWVSHKYDELKGYEEDGGYPSRYDKYVERKEIKFPFDVWYEGQYYKAGTWIVAQEPDNRDILWNDGLTLEEKSDYKSNNHWQMMPIYIPSYAEEGTGYIQIRVYAYNVEGRYEGSHNVEEAMELNMNTKEANYIATYSVKEQLSGHIYGFTVTGVDDKDMYDQIDVYETIWTRLGYSFCNVKEEKVSGTKNRFGQDAIRYQLDGTLTSFIQNADGTFSPDYNLLPLREGSNATAKMHTGDGRLWMGMCFGYNLKTIANLWGDNDYIEITPTLRFYSKKDGRLMDEIRMDGDQMISRFNRLHAVYYDDNLIMRDFFNTKGQVRNTIGIGNPFFESSYYTDAQTLMDGEDYKRYGNWIDYTLDRWNTTHRLYGLAAKTRMEVLDFKYPCFTFTNIRLDKNLRLLSGEWEQLHKNRNREGMEVATYYDYNENGYFDDGIQSTMETDFRDSMQTWYGGYGLPASLLLYDNINQDYWDKDSYTLRDYSEYYDVVINFDIIAYQNGTPHLAYGGYVNGGRVWEKEGYNTKDDTYIPGDVAIYDMTRHFADKFEGHLINVN